MKDFFRAVHLALQFRWTLAGAILCSVGAALLWGANISAVYPLVEVVFRGESLQDWMEGEATETAGQIARFESEIASLRETGAGDPALSYKQAQLEAARERRDWIEAIHQPLARHLPSTPFSTLLWLVMALVAGTILKDAFLVGNMMLVHRLAHRTTFQLRNRFFRQTLRMHVGSFGEEGASRLMSRFTNDMSHVNNGVATLLGKAVLEPLKAAACLAGAAIICWRLLLVSLVFTPLAVLLIQRLTKSIKRANRRAMEEMAQLYARLSETFTGIRAVKAFTMERYERGRFHRLSKKYFRKSMRIVFYNAMIKPATELFGIGVISLAMLAGGYLVLNQETHLFGIRMCHEPLELGAVLAFYALLAGVSDPARKLSDVLASLQRGSAAADRIYEMLDRESDVKEPRQPRSMPHPHRELAFDGVSFHYNSGEPVLRDVSLRIPFGQTVAIVGSNGCGKSTLVNLAPRFYDPVEGEVRIDHVNLRDVRLRDLRSRIGLVTQQTLLFDDTVLNNIRYGSPHASDEQTIEAAKKAHAHRFITEKLEHGYQTVIGEGGGRLSGGQRQRIALARAILRNPAILILDEATSQIDIESEQLIHQALEQFTRDRTTIMITHRVSTLALADRIVVMDAGRIADLGTHEELLGRCALYQRLYQVELKQSA